MINEINYATPQFFYRDFFTAIVEPKKNFLVSLRVDKLKKHSRFTKIFFSRKYASVLTLRKA